MSRLLLTCMRTKRANIILVLWNSRWTEVYFQGKKLRNELKYYINIHDYLTLRSKVSAVFTLDVHSLSSEGYGIRSLYFVGVHDHSLYDKNDGIFKREKYRIRIYNEKDDVINLERKSK